MVRTALLELRALSWGIFGFLFSLAISWIIRTKEAKQDRSYWSFAAGTAIAAGLIVGLLALAVHAPFVWQAVPR